MYAFDKPSARIMAAVGILVLGITQTTCGSGGDSDVVRSADQEGSSLGDVAPLSNRVDASSTAVDPAQRADLESRVVFLGTSLTAGLGLTDPTNRFTDQLQSLADSAGLPFRMVNAGVSGDTSAGGLRRITWLLRAPVAVLVLELGANDGLRGLSPDSMKANLQAVVDSTRTHYPDSRLLLSGMQAPPNLGQAYASAFSSVFSELARENGGTLIPFLLEGVAGISALNQSDGIHPTAEGHRMIAETVWRYLRPILDDLDSEQPTSP
jgi:acyl-CoA thioesterase-1